MTDQQRDQKTLLSATEAARDVFGVSERTFHYMREKGLLPPPIQIGPRIVRWVRAELEEAALKMPRQTKREEPPQFRRARKGA